MKLCEHCKRALDEELEKIEEATEIKWPEETKEHEDRQQAVSQNGNDGLVYEVVEKYQHDFEE